VTEKLYLDDTQARECSSVVISATPEAILLDRTIFYARSGGQPGDRGVLRWDGGETVIIDTIKGDGENIVHVPAPGSVLPSGTVTCVLDWERRAKLMRMHTAMHLLCAVLPGVSVTGGSVGDEKSRLDFDMPDPPTKESVEVALNALIAQDFPVTASWVDESLLDTNPELVRTLSVQPPRGTGRLRLVRIGRESIIDMQPCGGTHVTRTGEIGRIAVAKIENKGKQNRRISMTFATSFIHPT
jgi:misacylated tRNA(Ala) deacylase